MKKLKNVNQLQKEIGELVKERLSENLNGMKVEVSFINADYKTGKGYEFYVYHNNNNYDYKKVNVNYVENASVIDYALFVLESLTVNNNYIEHIASPEEKYISEILEATNVHKLFIIDGILYDSESDNSITLADIDEISYNIVDCKMVITDDDEIFTVDLVQEQITSNLYDEPVGETITADFIQKLVNEWNKLDMWCKLSNDRDVIYLKDKETGNVQELLGVDDIEMIKFSNNELFMEFDKEKNGFTSLVINKNGIEY